MRRWCSVFLFGWLLTAGIGCREGSPPSAGQGAGIASPYAQDMERICHCEERSGALEQPEGARPVLVAQWLGSNIQTDEARAFLARLAQTSAQDKAAMLEEESARMGLAGCPLAQTWRAERERLNSR